MRPHDFVVATRKEGAGRGGDGGLRQGQGTDRSVVDWRGKGDLKFLRTFAPFPSGQATVVCSDGHYYFGGRGSFGRRHGVWVE